MQICGTKPTEKKKTKSNLLIQNQELLRLRLTHEEKVFYTKLFYDNAVGGKVLKSNFLPLLGMLGTQIAEEFAERIFLAFSSNKKEITLCEYLKYIDIYHYGDDRERCRVTCKLIDKKSTGLIKLEDFKSYINLIMYAVQKVNGGSGGTLMSDQDVRDLFYHISKDKDSFTYQEFEDIYKEKPELVSWFDYFKNNKEDMLLIINQNVKNLLNMITEFLSSFMSELFKTLDNEEEKEIDISVFVQKVYYYSNELDKFRKKFLKKISKFNIRNTFDKLQNNNKNQKTNDLINALQKKLFNEDSNTFSKNLSSSFFVPSNEPITDKKTESLKKSNFLKSFKTLNYERNKSSQNLMNDGDNLGMTKFFKKVRNNLERTLSQNDKNQNVSKNNNSLVKFNKNNTNYKINNKNNFNESSASSSDEENNESIKKEKSNNNSPKKNSAIEANNAFAKNFVKQQTLFGSKFLKFGDKKNKIGLYESSVLESLSPKRKLNLFEFGVVNGGVEEEEDEERQKEPEKIVKKNSQDFSKKMPSYQNMKKNIINKIRTESNKNIKSNGIKSQKFKLSNKYENNTTNDFIGKDSIYDKSDYEKTLRLGSFIESYYIQETTNENMITEPNNYNNISKKKEEEKNFGKYISERNLNKNTNTNNNIHINISYANNQDYIPKNKLKKYRMKLNNAEKKAYGLNQLLFCARVVIENALDVSQTVSSCYKWVEENYLEAQIKKVIKEAKLKEKQKEDTEKYGNIGNLKKVAPAKKNIIRASDQSFKLLLNMIMGIQIAVQSIPNFHIKINEDLTKYMTNMLYSVQTINFGKRKEEVFVLKEFAGIIFNNIRLYLGYDKDDFISSISPQDFITELMISNQTIFEELCSTGKSGSLFYYTRDGKFIVKTIKRDEYRFIKQILPDYFKHLKTYPLSLLPKFLGCYVLTRKVKKKRDKIYFIVMINVFATSKHIHIRYDLKGSKIGRRVLTGKNDKEILARGDLALKDLDLEKRKEKIYIGEKRDILIKQIENDADFLCKIQANDYSLLVGIHYINKENKNNQNYASNIIQNKTNLDDYSIIKDSSLSDKSCDSRQEKLKALIDFEDGGIISETGNEIYFIGIIDILTKFGFQKKCEHFVKMIRYCSNNMSCTPPQMYRDRFVNYMNKIIRKNKSNTIIRNSIDKKRNFDNYISSNSNFTYNTSNNILIQNNTNNFYNIINNNNNITYKSGTLDDTHISHNISNGLINKERYSVNIKYNPENIIKEESEQEKASALSSLGNKNIEEL